MMKRCHRILVRHAHLFRGTPRPLSRVEEHPEQIGTAYSMNTIGKMLGAYGVATEYLRQCRIYSEPMRSLLNTFSTREFIR